MTIKKCSNCGEYTLADKHCNEETTTAKPPKFSFPDKYGEYRRKTKKET